MPESLTEQAAIDPGSSSTSLVRSERKDRAGIDLSDPAQVPPLPVQLDVCIPLPSFRVQDLLSLETGRVLTTEWPSSEDLPLWSGQVQLVWTEFEVVDQKLAVRVTRLM